MKDYRDKPSVYEEVEQLAQSRLADAHLLAGIMEEAEYAQAFQHYINRALECEAIITFCQQKQRK